MKHICPRCKHISADSNLWCQERYCPAEHAVEILDNGEWFGDIEIVELLVVTGTASIYRAQRAGVAVLLKIAHPGFEERLRREAVTLLEMTRTVSHPVLPVLLSAQQQGSLTDFPYGYIVWGSQPRLYEVFANADGDILSNYLLKIPQPWYQYVAWMLISVADVLALMHHLQKLHLCLNPDVLLVRFDKQDIPRLTLLDLGYADLPQNIRQSWSPLFCPPAYTAPELISIDGKIGPATDVYGLGMLLYEMLAGHPAYPAGQLKDDEIYANVRRGQVALTNRKDLKNMPDLAEKSIGRHYNLRPADVVQFATQLRAGLPPLPKEKKGFKINWRSVGIVLGALLAISLILMFAVVSLPQ